MDAIRTAGTGQASVAYFKAFINSNRFVFLTHHDVRCIEIKASKLRHSCLPFSRAA
jgi:hypothetical protein